MAGFSSCTHPTSRASSLLNLGASNSRTRITSSHSNPKILKPNRRSRYGKPLSPYDSDDGGSDGLDWLSDDDSGDTTSSAVDRQWVKLKSTANNGTGSSKNTERGWDLHASCSGYSLEESGQKVSAAKSSRYAIGKRNGDNFYSASVDKSSVGSPTVPSKDKVARSSAANRFSHFAEELNLEERYFPLLDYLSTFGLKDQQHFIQMYERHMPSLQINVESAKERLEYLMSVGVKHRDIRKIIMRQPKILEYTVENNLKSHVSFLGSLGIPESRIGQVITAIPSFSYSVENSLKPTIEYMLDEIGIHENDLSKVLQLSSQILVQQLDYSWNTHLSFLMKELDAPRESVVKMVTKHPQILHYSIEDGIRPRINFLRSIGMQKSDILIVLTRLTQVLSLSLGRNLKPKYIYLVNELRNDVHSLAKYPMYLSLTLVQRIRPRHRFLVSLKKAPKGPFPLSSFVPTDECFCQQLAGTSLDKYLDFCQRLLLKEFVKKYQRQ